MQLFYITLAANWLISDSYDGLPGVVCSLPLLQLSLEAHPHHHIPPPPDLGRGAIRPKTNPPPPPPGERESQPAPSAPPAPGQNGSQPSVRCVILQIKREREVRGEQQRLPTEGFFLPSQTPAGMAPSTGLDLRHLSELSRLKDCSAPQMPG